MKKKGYNFILKLGEFKDVTRQVIIVIIVDVLGWKLLGMIVSLWF